MSQAGRPTKLTPEVQERICECVRAGNYMETAAALAGIDKDTLYDWLKRGAREQERLRGHPGRRIRKSEAIYVEFSDAVAEALATNEANAVSTVSSAARKHEVVKHKEVLDRDGNKVMLEERTWEFDWRADAWRLERMFPDRWGNRQRHEHTGKDGGPIEIKTIGEIWGADGDTDDDAGESQADS